jgi:hypothetical protein
MEWYQFQHYFLVQKCHGLKVDGNSYIHEWTTLLPREHMIWYGMVGNTNVGFIWSHYLYFEECSPCVYKWWWPCRCLGLDAINLIIFILKNREKIIPEIITIFSCLFQFLKRKMAKLWKLAF